jgi:hypothetical protein
MTPSTLIGKTIKLVIEQPHTPEGRAGFWGLKRIEFTDGSAVDFSATQTQTVPRVEGCYTPPPT